MGFRHIVLCDLLTYSSPSLNNSSDVAWTIGWIVLADVTLDNQTRREASEGNVRALRVVDSVSTT